MREKRKRLAREKAEAETNTSAQNEDTKQTANSGMVSFDSLQN